jgi:hypothetical protein
LRAQRSCCCCSSCGVVVVVVVVVVIIVVIVVHVVVVDCCYCCSLHVVDCCGVGIVARAQLLAARVGAHTTGDGARRFDRGSKNRLLLLLCFVFKLNLQFDRTPDYFQSTPHLLHFCEHAEEVCLLLLFRITIN